MTDMEAPYAVPYLDHQARHSLADPTPGCPWCVPQEEPGWYMQPRPHEPGQMWVTQAGRDLWAERNREWAQGIIAYRAARYALDELSLTEAQAGVMWETPQFLVLNDCVAAAEELVAPAVRDQIDAEVLAELDYWHRLGRSLKHTRHPARRRWWQFR